MVLVVYTLYLRTREQRQAELAEFKDSLEFRANQGPPNEMLSRKMRNRCSLVVECLLNMHKVLSSNPSAI